jgi:hypothetical protein
LSFQQVSQRATDCDEHCFTASPTIGNAILVALIKLLEDYQSDIPVLKPWHCLAILTSIEVIITLIALIWYLGKIRNKVCPSVHRSTFFFPVITIQFNKQRARPDATQDDLLSTFVTSQTSANEIGFRFVFHHSGLNRPRCLCLLGMRVTRRTSWKNKPISFDIYVNETIISRD